jgi:hypothetical protein
MLRRPAPGASGGGRGAAARQAALEALTAAAASQLTGMFPLSIAGMWRPKPKRSAHKQQQGQQQQQQGQEQGQQQGQQQQQQQQHLGPEEALPVLGLHWLDQDVLAAVCQQGLSAVLLVLEGSSLQVGPGRGDFKSSKSHTKSRQAVSRPTCGAPLTPAPSPLR